MSQGLTHSVAAEVRAELARQGHSKKWLAARLGVSEMWVSRHLRGEAQFSVADLVRVARVLGVPAAELIPDSEAHAA